MDTHHQSREGRASFRSILVNSGEMKGASALRRGLGVLRQSEKTAFSLKDSPLPLRITQMKL
jgi:hypothetical protein